MHYFIKLNLNTYRVKIINQLLVPVEKNNIFLKFQK